MIVSAIVIQSVVRRGAARRLYVRMKMGATKIQSTFRMSVLRMFFVQFIRPAVVLLGRVIRGFNHRRRFQQKRWGALRLQICFRRFLRNSKLRKLMNELHSDLRSSKRFQTYCVSPGENSNDSDCGELIVKNKLKVLIGFKLIRCKWLDYCTVFHSAILGDNLSALCNVRFFGFDRSFTFGITFKDALETDVQGRTSIHYLALCPTTKTLYLLLNALAGFALFSAAAFFGFDAEDDEDDFDDGSSGPFNLLRRSNLRRRNNMDVVGHDGRDPLAIMEIKRAVHSSVDKGLIKEGWLKKKRDGLLWHKRWVVLSDDFIVIFKSPASLNNPNTAIPLQGCTVSRLANSKEPVLEVSSPNIEEKKGFFGGSGNRSFYLLAESEKELQDWLMPLRAVTGGEHS